MTQLLGGLGGEALDRQGRKSNFFSARKGCAKAPGPTESGREERIQRDADYQQGSSQLDLADARSQKIQQKTGTIPWLEWREASGEEKQRSPLPAMNKSKVHWRGELLAAPSPVCWGAQVLSVSLRFSWVPWTHHSQPQLWPCNSFLKTHTCINKDNESPPSRVSVGMCWWKIWVLALQCLIRSWRPNSPDQTTVPWTRTSSCTGPGKDRPNSATQVGEGEVQLVSPTNIKNQSCLQTIPWEPAYTGKGLPAPWVTSSVVCRYKPITKPLCPQAHEKIGVN